MKVDQIRGEAPHVVKTYSELVSKLAHLAFENPELVMLMRGQSQDHKAGSKTTLFPKMYRDHSNGTVNLYAQELRARYQLLAKTEGKLYQLLGTPSYEKYQERVGRSQLARWAILQHYEVCPTPLLDVTHSALVACSFAFMNAPRVRNKGYYLYVLGVPQLSGSVTISSAQALQVVRLSSVCPPETLRPYFQEGYLMGTYPSVDTIADKLRYARDEMDCARRLIAKFHLPTTSSFWDNGFQPLMQSAVYPDEPRGLSHDIRALKTDHS